MAQIVQCIRPGGMVLLMDYDYRCYDSTFELLPPLAPSDPHYRYAPVFLNEMSKSIARLGGIPDAPSFFHLLSLQEELGGIEMGDMSFPLGPPYPRPRAFYPFRPDYNLWPLNTNT
jgi:hypothetical protein